MSHIAIRKVNEPNQKTLPIFEEITKRCEAVRQRAFDLFEHHGHEIGHELDNWLKAEHEVMGWPAAQLVEKEGTYELQMTLPGFEPKEVEVTATPTELIVHAAAEEEKKAETGEVVWSEFGSNDVYRRIEVQHPINVDKVTAKLEKGILRINAPEIEKPKEIKVTAA